MEFTILFHDINIHVGVWFFYFVLTLGGIIAGFLQSHYAEPGGAAYVFGGVMGLALAATVHLIWNPWILLPLVFIEIFAFRGIASEL